MPDLMRVFGSGTLQLELSDITKQDVDAVVNAANPALAGGGGVDGAIHHSGGPAILKECQGIIGKIGRLAPGQAVITTGGRLRAGHVIHTVGPVWSGGGSGEAAILASAYRESLVLADKMALRSLAFPSIATGAYGYPVALAAPVAVQTVADYLKGPTQIRLVRFVLHDAQTLEHYALALAQAF